MEEKKYEEIGTNYRFFLGWRHAAFAGMLVIFYGVISLTLQIYKDAPHLAFVVPLLASPIGILLWWIDVRNRDLYHAAIRAGKVLEGSGGGFYTQLADNVVLPYKDSPSKKRSHTESLQVLFIGSTIILISVSIVLLTMTFIDLL